MSVFSYYLPLPIRIASAVLKSLFHSLMKLRWTPSSRSWLLNLDKRIRGQIVHPNYGEMVQVTYGNDKHSIWTVTVKGGQQNAVPLVILHGMGGGGNMFLNNIDALAEKRDVILIDLPGFGLSSRPELRFKKEGYWRKDTTADDIEKFYTDVLNLWFEKMGLERAVLLGHSYGGYISSVFCISHPERIKHLILADPWGFGRQPANALEGRPFARSKSIVLLAKAMTKMNVFTPLRVLGPLGPFVLNFLRADLKRKFNNYFTDNTFSDYFYACNTCDSPSGEVGFSRMTLAFGWARKPLIDRVQEWAEDLDVTFIFGARSWVDSAPGKKAKRLRPNSYVDVQVIVGAGHHVYADNAPAFNDMVQNICEAVDEGHQPHIVDAFQLRNQVLAKLLRRQSCDPHDDANIEDGGRHRRTMSAQELSVHQEMDFEENQEHGEEHDNNKIEKVQFSLEEEPGDEDEFLASSAVSGSDDRSSIARIASLEAAKTENAKTISLV